MQRDNNKKNKRGIKKTSFSAINWKKIAEEKAAQKLANTHFTLDFDDEQLQSNAILENINFDNTDSVITEIIVPEKNMFKEELDQHIIKVVVNKKLSSVNISEVHFTNFLSSDATVKADAVKDILNICGLNVPLSELPIDLNSGNYLVNDQTSEEKSERFAEVWQWYEDNFGKFTKNYNLGEKYKYENIEGLPNLGIRIIGYYCRFSNEFHINFLDPHHLLATSDNNINNYNSRKEYNNSILNLDEGLTNAEIE